MPDSTCQPIRATRFQRIQRVLVNLLIIFYLYTGLMMAWPWPASEALKDRLIGTFVTEHLLDLAVYHRLDLFSPYPPLYTGKLVFKVHYDNQVTHDWEYPREKLSPGDPPNSYDRYIFYYLCWNYPIKYQKLWPAFTRYISQHCEMVGAHPVKVQIIEHFAKIPEPKLGIGKPWVKPNLDCVLYTYDVLNDRGVAGDSIKVW